MCYDAETSLKTFMISAPISLYLALYGKTTNIKMYGWLFFYISFMQFIEYILWKNQQPGNKINSVVSKMIDPYLVGQPLVMLLAIYFLDKTNVNQLLLFNIIVLFFVTSHAILDKKTRYSKPDDNGHLSWDTITDIQRHPTFFTVLLTLSVLLVSKRDISTFTVALLGIASLEYHFSKSLYWGSGWCNTVNMIPMVLLGLNFLPEA